MNKWDYTPPDGLLVDWAEKSVAETGINTGELYLARRNTGWKLLTCKKLIRTDEGDPNFIIPFENEYCYDANECFRILEPKKP